MYSWRLHYLLWLFQSSQLLHFVLIKCLTFGMCSCFLDFRRDQICDFSTTSRGGIHANHSWETIGWFSYILLRVISWDEEWWNNWLARGSQPPSRKKYVFFLFFLSHLSLYITIKYMTHPATDLPTHPLLWHQTQNCYNQIRSHPIPDNLLLLLRSNLTNLLMLTYIQTSTWLTLAPKPLCDTGHLDMHVSRFLCYVLSLISPSSDC